MSLAVRLRESLYSVQSARKTSANIAESCDMNHALKPPAMIKERFQSSDVVSPENTGSSLFGQKLYIDSDVSAELQSKVEIFLMAYLVSFF